MDKPKIDDVESLLKKIGVKKDNRYLCVFKGGNKNNHA